MLRRVTKCLSVFAGKGLTRRWQMVLQEQAGDSRAIAQRGSQTRLLGEPAVKRRREKGEEKKERWRDGGDTGRESDREKQTETRETLRGRHREERGGRRDERET